MSLGTEGNASLRPLNSCDLVLFIWNNKLDSWSQMPLEEVCPLKTLERQSKPTPCERRKIGNSGWRTSSPWTAPHNPYEEPGVPQVLTETRPGSFPQQLLAVSCDVVSPPWPAVASLPPVPFSVGCGAGRGRAGIARQTSAKTGCLLSQAP